MKASPAENTALVDEHPHWIFNQSPTNNRAASVKTREKNPLSYKEDATDNTNRDRNEEQKDHATLTGDDTDTTVAAAGEAQQETVLRRQPTRHHR